MLFVTPALAANDVDSTPRRIDTFGADVTIRAGSVSVTSILVTAYSTIKTVTFIDSSAAVVLVIEVPVGSTVAWPQYGDKAIQFTNGLIYDDSASDVAAGDFIFVWTK